MSNLKDLYNKRLEEYNKYVLDKNAYDVRMDEYRKRLAECERTIRSKVDTLPENIKEKVMLVLEQCEGNITSDNVRDRLSLWRKLYSDLERMGLQLLEET